MRRNCLFEGITVSGGSAVVRAEDEPALRSREDRPVVPVGTEAVAIGIDRTTMNQSQHLQILLPEFSRRIDQHALHHDAVIGFPLKWFSFRQSALGEELVEVGDGLRL